MHTFGETGAGVPAFLAKLWRLVDDPETNNLICWNKDGRSFIIQNQAQFARELLPLNYKHNNMASFIRQLNMYGFHKITSIDNGGLKFDKDEMEFSHPCFKRNCPYLLEHIKRKIASSKNIEEKAVKPEAVSRVLQDVKAMRGRQDSLDSRFSVMKQENEALWREIASLRQKHAKQQQIVNKLIQFLITIVQPNRNVSGVKRMQLMINDAPENIKLCKPNISEIDCGPIIHELGEELLEEVADTDSELMDLNSPYNKSYGNYTDNESPSPHIERPQSSGSFASLNYDHSNQSAEDALNVVSAAANGGNNKMPASNSGGGLSIVQSVNPDGSKIVYHVTEVPETRHNDAASAVPANYNEENVLTTPMVRKEMLKQKNKQRRKQPIVGAAKVARLEDKTLPAPINAAMDQVHVKTEQPEINPMIFLENFNDDNPNLTPEVPLLSPNLSEDSIPLNVNVGIIDNTSGASNAPSTTQSQIFIPNNFISADMPANIFDDASFINTESNSIDNELKLNQLAQQPVASPLATDNFAACGTGSGGTSSDMAIGAIASTLAGVLPAAAVTPSSNDTDRIEASTSGAGGKQMLQQKKDTDMAVTNEEVNGHLDLVQDELETLKDLLRGDGYSLDANTLLGLQHGSTMTNTSRKYITPTLDYEFINKLFSDSDILSPYGLTLPVDASNQKKGSELMSYQPFYDLSDIIDSSTLDTEADTVSSPSNATHGIPCSALNTPHRE